MTWSLLEARGNRGKYVRLTCASSLNNILGRRKSRVHIKQTRPPKYFSGNYLCEGKPAFGGCQSAADMPPIFREIVVAHRTQLDAIISRWKRESSSKDVHPGKRMLVREKNAQQKGLFFKTTQHGEERSWNRATRDSLLRKLLKVALYWNDRSIKGPVTISGPIFKVENWSKHPNLRIRS